MLEIPILLFSTERREESAGLKFYVVICTDAFIFFIELLGDLLAFLGVTWQPTVRRPEEREL